MKFAFVIALGALILNMRAAEAAEFAESSGDQITRASSQGLLTPDMDQALWGIGQIPNLKHLASKRFNYNKCRDQWNTLKRMKQNINPKQIRATLGTLRASAARFGVSARMVDKTLAVYLRNQGEIPNQRYVTIFDHTQRSTKPRFVVLDLFTGQAHGFRSAHGKGSDRRHQGVASYFTNRANTNANSLGCALTGPKRFKAKKTPQERGGRSSVNLFGFEPTNDNMCERGVYMHAAPYVGWKKPGRSWGCPAFRYEDRDKIYDMIEGGGLLCQFAN